MVLAISYATSQPRENYLKKLSFLAAIVFAMAFGSTAMATGTVSSQGAFRYDGVITRSSHGPAGMSIIGDIINPNLTVHITDATVDLTCTINSSADVKNVPPVVGGNGSLALYFGACVNNSNGETVYAASGSEVTFTTAIDSTLTPASWNVQGAEMVFSIPGLCSEAGLGGSGNILNP